MSIDSSLNGISLWAVFVVPWHTRAIEKSTRQTPAPAALAPYESRQDAEKERGREREDRWYRTLKRERERDERAPPLVFLHLPSLPLVLPPSRLRPSAACQPPTQPNAGPTQAKKATLANPPGGRLCRNMQDSYPCLAPSQNPRRLRASKALGKPNRILPCPLLTLSLSGDQG